jgi:hypothetical protein
MKVRVILLVVLIFLLAIIAGLLWQWATTDRGYSITIGGGTYPITALAMNETTRERGLQGQEITDKTFMLFVFPYPGLWPFWMYQTDGKLDIIWLSLDHGQGEIVDLHKAAPCFNESQCPVYYPKAPANYVIEMQAGFIRAHNLTIGSPVTVFKN